MGIIRRAISGLSRAAKALFRTQKRQLKKLEKLGLYNPKTPIGNEPTRYQKSIIQKYSDVLSGKAVVVKPSNPQSYKNVFDVKGKNVIVPRGKGESIRVNKQGQIKKIRRGPRKEKISSTGVRVPAGKMPVERQGVQYAVPFKRKIGKGKYIIEWHRFASYKELSDYMSSYEPNRYPDWHDYVFEEQVIPGKTRAERDKALNQRAVLEGKVKDIKNIGSGLKK